MSEEERSKELKKLKKDKWEFILQRGAIWGIIMYVFTGFIGFGFDMFNFVLWVIGGFCFGWLLWYFSVKKLEKKK